MLTGENGILTNANNASASNVYSEAVEQVKLAYMSVKTEIMASTVANSSYDARTAENTTKLGQIVAKDLNDTRYWSVDYGTAGKIGITYTNSSIKANSISEGKPAQNGKILFKIELEIQEATLYIDEENNNNVTSKLTDTTGNPIEISSITQTGQAFKIGEEQFEVIYSNKNGKVVALAWNNITLPTDLTTTKPSQTNSVSNPKIQFSSENYWTEITNFSGYPAVNMNDSRNYVQPYIVEYQKTLPTGVSARIPLEADVSALSVAQRQPGRANNYWLGSAYSSNGLRVVDLDRYTK